MLNYKYVSTSQPSYKPIQTMYNVNTVEQY